MSNRICRIPCLCALGTALGARSPLILNSVTRGWFIPTFWGVIVAHPGSKKSPAADAVIRHVHDLEKLKPYMTLQPTCMVLVSLNPNDPELHLSLIHKNASLRTMLHLKFF
ncbi:MAG: DUF3987 domain-containing protein [bacterium]|nr:DUF3987 domain-containing protein [bacterium]